MTDDDALYHMVEHRNIADGKVTLIRGARKTEAELQAEAEGAAEESAKPLYVRIVEGFRPYILICDENGNPLPNQTRTSVDQTVERQEITVTFFIDGERVAFA